MDRRVISFLASTTDSDGATVNGSGVRTSRTRMGISPFRDVRGRHGAGHPGPWDGPVHTVPRPFAGRAHAALIGIIVPLASSVLGIVTVSTPSLKVAVTLPGSTVAGSRRARANAPYARSTRW